MKIRNVTYADEMKYIVEFNFSSGVSISDHVKLDVVGELPCVVIIQVDLISAGWLRSI